MTVVKVMMITLIVDGLNHEERFSCSNSIIYCNVISHYIQRDRDTFENSSAGQKYTLFRAYPYSCCYEDSNDIITPQVYINLDADKGLIFETVLKSISISLNKTAADVMSQDTVTESYRQYVMSNDCCSRWSFLPENQVSSTFVTLPKCSSMMLSTSLALYVLVADIAVQSRDLNSRFWLLSQ